MHGKRIPERAIFSSQARHTGFEMYWLGHKTEVRGFRHCEESHLWIDQAGAYLEVYDRVSTRSEMG